MIKTKKKSFNLKNVEGIIMNDLSIVYYSKRKSEGN